jgi:hypothetical protein
MKYLPYPLNSIAQPAGTQVPITAYLLDAAGLGKSQGRCLKKREAAYSDSHATKKRKIAQKNYRHSPTFRDYYGGP